MPPMIRSLLAGSLITLAACGADADLAGGEWTGTMRDSAGVTFVDNPNVGIWTDATRWRVDEQLRIGEAEGDANFQFGQIVGLDVASEGTIFVLDQMSQRVQAFDVAGNFVRTLGRPGSGPGELSRGTSAVIIVTGDTVIVPDVMQQRAVRFATNGALVSDFPLPLTEGIPVRWDRAADRVMVQQTRMMPMPGQAAADQQAGSGVLLRRNSGGTIIDTLVHLPTGESFTMEGGMPRIRMFAAEPLWSMLSNGGLGVAVNDAYRVEIRAADGSLERVIVRQVTGSEVRDEDERMLKERMSEMMSQQGAPPQAVQMLVSGMEFAERFPVIAELLGGPEGTLWVRRVKPVSEMDFSGDMMSLDFGARDWDVYDREGRFLGAIELPERFRPLRVVGDDIFGVQLDDLDVQQVVQLRVERPAVR